MFSSEGEGLGLGLCRALWVDVCIICGTAFFTILSIIGAMSLNASYLQQMLMHELCAAELHFAVFTGQYFVMMSPSDVNSSSSVSHRAISRLPICSRPTIVSSSSIVRDDRRRQTHKEGNVYVWLIG